MRYYYKSIDGKGYLNLKTPLTNMNGYVEISEQEFNEHLLQTYAPNAEQVALQTKRDQIASLKAQLAVTDYQAIKYVEGWLTEEEYTPIKAQRKAWRDEINQLESEIKDVE